MKYCIIRKWIESWYSFNNGFFSYKSIISTEGKHDNYDRQSYLRCTYRLSIDFPRVVASYMYSICQLLQ